MTPEEFVKKYREARASGDIELQIELLRDNLSYAQQTLNPVGEIAAMRALGNVYQEQGDLKSAHKWRLEALRRARQPDAEISDELRMELTGDLGRSFVEARDWGEAEHYTRAALELAERLGHGMGRCIYRINLILILDFLNRREDAYRLAKETRPIALELGDPYPLGLYFINTAELLLHERRLNEGLRHAMLARAFAAQLPPGQGAPMASRAAFLIGDGYMQARQLMASEHYATLAEQALREAASSAPQGDMSFSAEIDAALLRLHGLSGRLDAAITHAYQQLDHLELARQNLGYEDFQRTYFQQVQPAYDTAVTLMLRQQDTEGAFLATERARSRLLLTQLGRGPAVWDGWALKERQELKAAAAAYGAGVIQQLPDRTPSEGPSGPSAAIDDARERFLHAYDAHRSLRPQWIRPLEESPIGAPEARALVRPGSALLSYFVTQEATAVFTITVDGIHFQHLAYPRRQAEEDARQLVHAFAVVGNPKTRSRAAMSRLERRLERLYAILIAPVLAALDDATHWIIVPHGPLHGIPWAALRGAGRYLVEQHSLSFLPSATFARSSAAEGPEDTGPTPMPATPALLLADPDRGDAALKLPSAEPEIVSVAAALGTPQTPDVVSLCGPDATAEAYREHAPAARLVHFACHSFFDARAPLLSFLKLAGMHGPAPQRTSGCLHAYEVMEQRLSATLVTLASCRSGTSGIATGDEQLGLVRTFLVSGAKSVLGARGVVWGQASARLFSRFYSLACTLPLAVALAQAQRELMVDPRFAAPPYWAPFMLVGAWNTILATPQPRQRPGPTI
jgi:CHAT domain-containing protein